MPVKEIMQYGATTVSPDESVNRVMNLMTHHRGRHMNLASNMAPVASTGRQASQPSTGAPHERPAAARNY